MNLQPFGPGCAWYDLHQQYPPNIEWCEEKICSLFVTPFNTWSNLAYIIVGFLIWNKTRNSSSRLLRFFSVASVLVGASSFVFHMSLNYFTQIFDYFGMYVFCILMLMSNLTRMGRWPKGNSAFYRFWLCVVGLTLLTCLSVMVHFPIQLYVLLLVIAIVRTELIQKITPPKNRNNFWWSVAFLIVAALLSALDLSRILCWPDNHWFQAHGTWHVITAVSLYFAYLHARQFVVADQK